MEQRNISITPELLAHAEDMVASGRYANVSDYMRALIRQDREREEANAWLRQVHEQAIASGKPVDITPEKLGDIVQQGIERANAENDRQAG